MLVFYGVLLSNHWRDGDRWLSGSSKYQQEKRLFRKRQSHWVKNRTGWGPIGLDEKKWDKIFKVVCVM